MSPREATELFNTFGLDEDKRKLLEPLVGSLLESEPEVKPSNHVSSVSHPKVRSKSPWKPPNPDRGLWLASAWLCGASYSLLALLDGVSEQAIQQSVSRSMPSAEERHINRMGYGMSRERAEALRVRYNSNVVMLREMTPVECARWLLLEEEE